VCGCFWPFHSHFFLLGISLENMSMLNQATKGAFEKAIDMVTNGLRLFFYSSSFFFLSVYLSIHLPIIIIPAIRIITPLGASVLLARTLLSLAFLRLQLRRFIHAATAVVATGSGGRGKGKRVYAVAAGHKRRWHAVIEEVTRIVDRAGSIVTECCGVHANGDGFSLFLPLSFFFFLSSFFFSLSLYLFIYLFILFFFLF
jgi:hypothetical protein